MTALVVTAEIVDSPSTVRIVCEGRVAWALCELVRAGSGGVTPIDTPGPRWSAYVHRLRKLGVKVETTHEEHGGPFAGRHARYRLTAPVTILRREGGEASAV